MLSYTEICDLRCHFFIATWERTVTNSKNKLLITGFAIGLLLFSGNAFTGRPSCPCEEMYREAVSYTCAASVALDVSNGPGGADADLLITGYANGVTACSYLTTSPRGSSECTAFAGYFNGQFCTDPRVFAGAAEALSANDHRACANLMRELARTVPDC